MAFDDKDLNIILKLKDQLTSELRGAQRGFQSFSKGARASLKTVQQNWTNLHFMIRDGVQQRLIAARMFVVP